MKENWEKSNACFINTEKQCLNSTLINSSNLFSIIVFVFINLIKNSSARLSKYKYFFK